MAITLDGTYGVIWPSSTAFANKILQVQSINYTTNYTNATAYTYLNCAASTVTLTALGTNSKFLLMADTQLYSGSCSGCNIGFYRYGTTLIRGVSGSSGDEWACGFNGTATAGAWNIEKFFYDSPGLQAGTSVSYSIALGLWSSGSIQNNYAGYGNTSQLTVMEIL